MEDMLVQAKKKALRLLESMDRTEEQLRLKLKQKAFSDEAIDEAIEYVKSFGYINDERYAECYILGRQKTKSRREIYASLCQKGMAKEIVEQAMETCYESYDEKDTIRTVAEKKHYSESDSSEEEKKKIYQYLLRRGFRNEDIRQVIQFSFRNA